MARKKKEQAPTPTPSAAQVEKPDNQDKSENPGKPETVKHEIEVVVPTVAPLAVAALPSADEMTKRAEEQIKLRKAYVRLVAQELRPEDCIMFGEEVYIPAKPCRDILSWARINVKLEPMTEHRYSSPDGEFIIFEVGAKLTDQNGREIDILGNRSTRDDFFGIAGKQRICPECKIQCEYGLPWDGAKYKSYYCKQHPRVKPEEIVHYKPLYDVEIGDVRKAAVTNLWNKAIKAIGLAPTIEDLAAAGVDVKKIKKPFEFGSSKDNQPKRESSPSHQEPKPTSNAPATQPSSSQQKPASDPTPAPEPPPSGEFFVKGQLQEVKASQTKEKKQPFLALRVADKTLTAFDNKELVTDSRGSKSHAFVLLGKAKGQQVEFRVRQSGKYLNVTKYMRIDTLEWDDDGILVLRREGGVPKAEIPPWDPPEKELW